MKVLSLNVGKPRRIEWNGKFLLTSIYKFPVKHTCKVSFTNIEGDLQGDLKNHGGVDKAVYSYDISYYDHWQNHLTRKSWEHGLFGENLTTQGLLDDEVKIGNIYKIGSAKIQALQPRFPCIKLNARFGLQDMIERFYEQKRFGVYFRVIEEGFIKVNDQIELIEESSFNVTIKDITYCKTSKGEDQEKLKEILEITYFPKKLKESLRIYLR